MVHGLAHTPGPWTVANNSRSVLAGPVKINQQVGPGGQSAAAQALNDLTLLANAKLIAEAPEMFQVIQRLAEPGFIGESELKKLIQECRRIVAKVV